MSFKKFKALEESIEEELSQNSISEEVLKSYFIKEKRKKEAKSRPFEFFYEDIINTALDYDFNAALGNMHYLNAERDARCCLDICDEFNKISPYSVNGWLVNALKFIDHIVLHYLQDYMKLKLLTYKGLGVERSRYKQLSELKVDAEIAEAGLILLHLYKLRNELTHRTIIRADKTQELIRPKYGKVRKEVRKNFPKVMHNILIAYKNKRTI